MTTNKTNSWREFLEGACKSTGDNFDDLITTLSQNEMDEKFDDGYGSLEGRPFTAWSKDYVYFPACYDGAEWVAFVPRNPNGQATEHIGGGSY